MRIARWVSVVLAVALLLPSTEAVSAPWQAAWHRTPRFSVGSVATDVVGNVYVAGFNPRGDPSVWVMALAKYDTDGQRLWAETWRSRSHVYIHAMAIDVTVSLDGADVFVVGALLNDVGEARQPRVWAYSSDGTLRWSHRSRAAPHGEWASAAAVPGGVVSAGYEELIRWRRNGTQRWHRKFLGVPGDVCEVVRSVAVDGNALYVVGFLDMTPTCNDWEGTWIPQDADIVIQKRTLSGAVVWSRVFRDAARANDQALSVAAADRRVFVAGEADAYGWLGRLTPKGRFAWMTRWGLERPIEVATSPRGSVYTLNDHGDGAFLALRTFSSLGAQRDARRTVLDGREDGTGLATGPRQTVAVTARVFARRGDLWLMPA